MATELYLHCKTCISAKQADKIAVVARFGRYEVVCESHESPMLIVTIKSDTSSLLSSVCTECCDIHGD